MSDTQPCEHKPNYSPTLYGQTGWCKVCLEYDFVADEVAVDLGGVRLGPRWTPSEPLKIEAQMRQAGKLPIAPAEQPAPSETPAAGASLVNEQEAAVLKVLGKHHPCLRTTPQIADEIRFSADSIGDYLLKLQHRQPPLVTKPVKKSGRTLTEDGLRVVASLSDAAGASFYRKPR